MTVKEIIETCEVRLKELDEERNVLLGTLSHLRGEGTPAGGHERRSVAHDKPARHRKTLWSRARRLEQSRRMKALHRKGVFRTIRIGR